jgi:hypothetical protein
MGWHPCCCDPCIIVEDDFDRDNSTDIGNKWSEESGDWEISSNSLSIGVSSALVLTVKEHSSSDMSVTVDFTASNNGDKMRVVLSAVDDSNYIFCEVEFDSGTSTVRVGDVISSVETVRDTNTTVGITVGNTYQVVSCWDNSDETICISVLSSGTEIVRSSSTATVTGGKKSGLATGDTVSGSVTFDDFLMLEKSPTCQECCYCDKIPHTDSFDVLDSEWDDISSGAYSFSVSANKLICTANTTSQATSGELRRCTNVPETEITISVDIEKGVSQSGLHSTSLIAYTSLISPFSTFSIVAQWNGTGGAWSSPHYTAGTTSGSTNIAVTPLDGDEIKFVWNNDATNNLKFYVNSSLVHTETFLFSPPAVPLFRYSLASSCGLSPPGNGVCSRFENLSVTGS